MSFIPFSALACPLDGDPLHRQGQTWRCAAGHSFDIARQGYTHLLPVQHKRSRDPGDSKAMVAARQRFLNAGHYQPIAEAVSRLALAERPAGDAFRCLDAGCGEGYYLRRLAASAPDAVLSLLGLDISKWAVLSAAKQERAISSAARQDKDAETPESAAGRQVSTHGREERASWMVGSNANLPIQDGSLDCVLCLFGFPVYPEFVRVLEPGGVLIQADAGPDHLRELREIIYPSLKPERERSAAVPEGLVRQDVETIRYSLALEEPQAIADLLAMTPHLYRASAEGRARAEALEALTVTVDVRLTRFARGAGNRETTPSGVDSAHT
ncbi:methyltransferase domain-containing protein [Salinicola sp. LHM]|jgi:23S rRNA (guanine745-N1)-methyltransferase|uniref:putative RNA methyltransferase n=1 Tax=unclassified Salinicola TaxID=2634022 RepID=UPI0008DC9405|nr:MULTISPECIES: methyltransferase domain-containing protein [unclassified Salinicola]OHZ04937.1 rRNA (guanine-N1)-methyltransferase [Salinicola sp. MIT1003]WQH32286.1 methyltransferase domain-containing protein [Salinicola sp. LHM]